MKNNQKIFSVSKNLKKNYYALKNTKTLKKILTFNITQNRYNKLKINFILVNFKNLLILSINFSIFENIFFLWQEEAFISFFLGYLCVCNKENYEKYIQKYQLSRNNTNILCKTLLFCGKIIIYFINQMKKKLKFLFSFNKFKIIFSIKNIIKLCKKGLIVSFISKIYKFSFFIFIKKKFKIFLCKK
jgi:hypothetical protein